MKIAVLIAAVMLGIGGPFYLMNASWLARPASDPQLLAHRGVHQMFSQEGLTRESCTAERSLPSGHTFIENTLPSIAAAFDAGADIVEIDITATADGAFAVFHDWTLDCRTDGSGPVRQHTMDELRGLDVGFGYTSDGGETFPLRGSGVGLMPSLEDVLTAFPERRFLIDIKSNDPAEADRLLDYLAGIPGLDTARLSFYGGWRPIERLRELQPALRASSVSDWKRCGQHYLLIGWSGHVPRTCANLMLVVPTDYGFVLWGWPNRFLQRMQSVGTEVYAGGDANFSVNSVDGLNDPRQLRRLPEPWAGGVYTDRIELIGPIVGQRARQDGDQ